LAVPAQPVRKVRLGQLERLDLRDQAGNLAIQVVRVHPVRRASKARLVQPVQPE